MEGPIEQKIQSLFIAKGVTLSLAESCTGGAISSRLVNIAGASQYFLGSLVTYSNHLKQKVLQVPEEIIKQKGAVSEETVIAMVKGLLKVTGSDYGIAVSGIAGPGGGTVEKPVGTVWAAIGQKEKKPYSWCFKVDGDRKAVIQKSCDIILSKLLKFF